MLFLLTATALAAPLAPGDLLEEAIGIHISDAGLAQLGNVVEGLLPPVIPFSGVSGTLECDADDATPLSYTLADMAVTITAQDIALETSEGRLDLWMFITMGSSPSALTLSGDCTFLTGLDETCAVEMPVTAATIHVGIQLGMENQQINATVDAVEFELSPIGNPLSDCTLADAIGTLLNQNSNALSDIILGLVLPELEGLATEIESTLSDGLGALKLETELAFGDGSVQLEIFPTTLDLADNGLFIGLGAQLTPDNLSDCVGEVLDFEPQGSGWPAISAEAWNTGLPYDMGLLIGRDFMDYTFWNLWAAGVLCMEIEEIQGAPVSTDLMGIFLGDAMTELFSETADARLSLFMPDPPHVAFYEDDPVLGLVIDAMHLELSAKLDARWARLFQTTMQGEVGIDPGIASGSISPLIDIPADLFDMEETYSELLESGYAASMAELMDVLLSTNLLPIASLPSFPLPDLMGASIDSVFWLTSDDTLWQGGFILLDTRSVQSIEAPGCSGESGLGCDGGSDLDVFAMLGCEGDDLLGCGESSSGCEDGGCGEGGGCEDSGCSTHNGRLNLPTGRWFLLGLTGLIFRARRRT
jgi:hypothetical protein